MTTITPDILATTKRAELVELLDALEKHGTKAQRAGLKKAKTNDEKRAMALELAARARRGRKVHVFSLGFAACKVEANDSKPDLLELLTTPTTKVADDATCARCRELLGLDEHDPKAEAEELAQVEAYQRKLERDRQHAEKKARERNVRRMLAADPSTSTATVDAIRFGFDDGHGTSLREEHENLTVVFPYKGKVYEGRLLASGRLELADVMHASPSAAGGAITGGAVNGWRRWRYQARDGLTYPIARLRGENVPPVRTGVTGRRPTKEAALKRHADAQARAAKLSARIEAARAQVQDLERRHADALEQVGKAATAARALGADLEPDLFPVEDGGQSEAAA